MHGLERCCPRIDNRSFEKDNLFSMAQLNTLLTLLSLSIIELLLVLASLVLIFAQVRRAAAPRHAAFDLIENKLSRLSRRPTLSLAFVALLVLVPRILLIPVIGYPQPAWHDEFSYLLAADTFAHGRITNPTHPMWRHFETFHEIQQPTYMSMYPPAQGLVLGAGQLFGHPWIGQCIITALMCAAMCWMFQGWLPPGWALLGGIIAALRVGILSYWMNGYWSASVVALGGALMLGAFPRLKRRPSVRTSLCMGLGIIILANARPYEGLTLALTVATGMLIWVCGPRSPGLSLTIKRILLPLLLSVLLGAAATGYYYFRVTGSPFRLAYQVNRATYSRAPYFIWQSPGPDVSYQHPVMKAFYDKEFRYYEDNRTVRGYLEHAAFKLFMLWRFYFGPLFTITLLALPWVVRDRKMFFLLVAGTVAMLGLAIETWMWVHYLAPVTCAIYVIILQCLRHIRHWRWQGFPVGVAFVRSVPVICCGMIFLRVAAVLTHTPIEPDWPHGNMARVAIERTLEQLPGKQLVFVYYDSTHNVDFEWVFNGSNIDTSKVVWARDMGAKENQELIQFFDSRNIWLLRADQPSPSLVAYANATISENN